MPPIQPLRGVLVNARELPSPPTSQGDQIIFTDAISDSANPGVVIGEHSGFCTLVRVTPGGTPDVYQCEGTIRLPNGQITGRGLVSIPRPDGDTATVAITGGTGVYDNLRGQARVTKISDTEQHFEFDTHG